MTSEPPVASTRSDGPRPCRKVAYVMPEPGGLDAFCRTAATLIPFFGATLALRVDRAELQKPRPQLGSSFVTDEGTRPFPNSLGQLRGLPNPTCDVRVTVRSPGQFASGAGVCRVGLICCSKRLALASDTCSSSGAACFEGDDSTGVCREETDLLLEKRRTSLLARYICWSFSRGGEGRLHTNDDLPPQAEGRSTAFPGQPRNSGAWKASVAREALRVCRGSLADDRGHL